MSRMPKSSSYALLAAYREHDEQADLKLQLPELMPLSQAPPAGRWRLAVDLAARLMQAVADETQDYMNRRSESWTTGMAAQSMNQNIDMLNDILAQIDDIRSHF